MKKYEKPVLTAITLSGNDQLCGSCAGGTTLFDKPALAQWILMKGGYGLGDDGVVDGKDFIGLFGNSETECSKKIESYCKFTSANSDLDMVAWS